MWYTSLKESVQPFTHAFTDSLVTFCFKAPLKLVNHIHHATERLGRSLGMRGSYNVTASCS